MTDAILRQAALLKQHQQEETAVALHWISSGIVREDSTFRDGEGDRPLHGCLERFAENTNEMSLIGERWDQEALARWCKREADNWFQGFPDDTLTNRKDFTASLYSLAKAQLGLSDEARSKAWH